MSHKRERRVRLRDDLRGRDGAVGDGLIGVQTRDAGQRLGFQFPPALRALLRAGLPVGGRFPGRGNGAELEMRMKHRAEDTDADLARSATAVLKKLEE